MVRSIVVCLSCDLCVSYLTVYQQLMSHDEYPHSIQRIVTLYSLWLPARFAFSTFVSSFLISFFSLSCRASIT